MNLVLLGAAGSGKGTQADLISEKFSLPHISTGELFRKSIERKEPLGLEAEKYMNKGILVPQTLTLQILKSRIEQKDCKKGFILEGYPRTEEQANSLDEITKLDKVIYIKIDFGKLKTRLINRRVCENCGKNFDVRNLTDEQKCLNCGGKLYRRKDDYDEAIQKRFDEFNSQTKPLIDFYKKKGILFTVDGDMKIDEVFKQVKQVLENK